MLKIVETAVEGKLPATLDDLARKGARRMLMEALEAELSEYVERPARSAGRTAALWWCATATLERAR